jgi:hypothetical protein
MIACDVVLFHDAIPADGARKTASLLAAKRVHEPPDIA